jgi:hypothetical protein
MPARCAQIMETSCITRLPPIARTKTVAGAEIYGIREVMDPRVRRG